MTTAITTIGDGLYYAPLGIEIDPRRDDLGHPDRPDLADIINDDRPHKEGKLQCLYCKNHRHKIEWGYLRRDPRCPQNIFEHLNTTIRTHYPTAPESDKHKSLVDYEMRTIEAQGISVQAEVRTKSGRARSDFRTFGGPIDLAGEVQVTQLTAATVSKRTKIAFTDGLTPLWTTDIPTPEWIEKGPRAVIGSTTPERIQAGTDLLIVGGASIAEIDRCGRRGGRCPTTRSFVPCGQLHAYLTPARGLHLDALVAGAATGEWRLLTEAVGRRVNYRWLPRADLDRYLADHAEVTSAAASRVELEPDSITNRIRRIHDPLSSVLVEQTKRPRQRINLDWRRNFTGPPCACRICRKLAFTRDDDGLPCHKICAERELERSGDQP